MSGDKIYRGFLLLDSNDNDGHCWSIVRDRNGPELYRARTESEAYTWIDKNRSKHV